MSARDEGGTVAWAGTDGARLAGGDGPEPGIGDGVPGAVLAGGGRRGLFGSVGGSGAAVRRTSGAILPVRAFAGRDARARLRRPIWRTGGVADPDRRAGSRSNPAGRLSKPRVPLHAEAGVCLHGIVEGSAIRLARSMRSLDFSAKLGGIACPATVVCGERDRANRGAAEELQRLLPNAELRIIPGAGHEVNRDAPEALAALLREATADAPK